MSKGTSKIRREHLRLSGLDIDDYSDWAKKYSGLQDHNRYRVGVNCLLSFEDYINLVVQSGLSKPYQIGSHKGQYCLGRLGDRGDYVIGNCRFITIEQNRQEAIASGGYARASEKRTGRTKESHDYIAKVASIRSNRTKDTHSYLNDLAKEMTGTNKYNSERVAKMALTKSKSFRLISPSGEVHEGTNLNQFCQDNKLLQSPMSALCRGQKLKYKGWTGQYVKGNE